MQLPKVSSPGSKIANYINNVVVTNLSGGVGQIIHRHCFPNRARLNSKIIDYVNKSPTGSYTVATPCVSLTVRRATVGWPKCTPSTKLSFFWNVNYKLLKKGYLWFCFWNDLFWLLVEFHQIQILSLSLSLHITLRVFLLKIKRFVNITKASRQAII